MEMKFRAVPREVYDVMGLNENFNYLWNPDPVSSLIGLGSSFVLEFFEFYGERIGDYYDAYIQDPKLKDERFAVFVGQERRHAAAHRKLNNFITKSVTPPVREEFHPRVYAFMHEAYKGFAEPIIAGIERDKANGKTQDSFWFKEAVQSIAIFESEVCMTGFAFFENLFDNGRFDLVTNMSGNLGVLYLLGYHYAEEMEHCCVSIEAFETVYNEKLWTKERIDQHINQMDFLANQIVKTTQKVAGMLKQTVTTEKIINSVAFQARALAAKKYITEGFTARESEVLQKREYFVGRWDSEWAPRLLEIIKEKIDENDLASINSVV
ncbi:metal-dependent hydrolase [Pantoea sp.]|uniref:metal-dependent hydrolase n=1 Tax=Pantoea sp. TaxID=69393 RepID=UPI00289E6EB9|nr:metal-dependent hydrolase [Pantoea sp.]